MSFLIPTEGQRWRLYGEGSVVVTGGRHYRKGSLGKVLDVFHQQLDSLSPDRLHVPHVRAFQECLRTQVATCIQGNPTEAQSLEGKELSIHRALALRLHEFACISLLNQYAPSISLEEALAFIRTARARCEPLTYFRGGLRGIQQDADGAVFIHLIDILPLLKEGES